jgi:hypothetical protein
MTREEKCKLAVEKGYVYNPETGKVFNRFGVEMKSYLKQGYLKLGIVVNKKTYVIKHHQFAWYWVNKKCVDEIDHINGIKDDNRICNLRSVSHKENMWNLTKAKGYCWNKKDKKWVVSINCNGRYHRIGSFNTETEARETYLYVKERTQINVEPEKLNEIIETIKNRFKKESKGYTFHKKYNKWMVRITVNYKSIYLGSFNTEEEAREIYLIAKEKYHNYGDSK